LRAVEYHEDTVRVGLLQPCGDRHGAPGEREQGDERGARAHRAPSYTERPMARHAYSPRDEPSQGWRAALRRAVFISAPAPAPDMQAASPAAGSGGSGQTAKLSTPAGSTSAGLSR